MKVKRDELMKELFKNINKVFDETTIKVAKGDKTLIEIDGGIIQQCVDIVQIFTEISELDSNTSRREEGLRG